MKKTVILYWAKGGSVEKAANIVLNTIGNTKADLFDLADFELNKLENYENIIMGIATIGADVWYDATDTNRWNEFFVNLSGKNLAKHKLAVFGLGDQILYPDNFVDSLGYIRDEVGKLGGKLLGKWPAEGYEFNESEGYADGMFCGLALDEDQQPELTEERIHQWINKLNLDMAF